MLEATKEVLINKSLLRQGKTIGWHLEFLLTPCGLEVINTCHYRHFANGLSLYRTEFSMSTVFSVGYEKCTSALGLQAQSNFCRARRLYGGRVRRQFSRLQLNPDLGAIFLLGVDNLVNFEKKIAF